MTGRRKRYYSIVVEDAAARRGRGAALRHPRLPDRGARDARLLRGPRASSTSSGVPCRAASRTTSRCRSRTSTSRSTRRSSARRGTAVRGPDPDSRDGPDRRARHRGALEVQGGPARSPRRRRPVPVAAAARGLAEARSRTRGSSCRRSRWISIPTRSTRSRPRGRSSRSRAARRRSTSPTGSTPTSGTGASGARVNGKLVPLRTPLASGDIVEILTAPNQTPSRDWLSFVATSRARHKIRHFIHTEEKRQAVELGRRLLDRELKKFRRTLKKLESAGAPRTGARRTGASRSPRTSTRRRLREARSASGPRAVRPGRGARARPESEAKESAVSRVVRKILPFGAPDIVVVGHNDLLATLAKCCSPVPGEKIVGYITRGRGVSVHSESCPNVQQPALRPGAPDRRGLGGREEGRRTRSSSRSSSRTGRACSRT